MNGVENQERLVSLPQGMWCGQGCNTVLDSLEGELIGCGGLVLITGSLGVGKSLLLDCYSKYLKKEGQNYYFMSAGELREVDFFNVLASGLGIQGLYTEKLQFIVELSNYLYSLAERQEKLTLIIDDCELLSQQILDVLRLIVQVEKDGEKLVQLILVGRRKFGQILAEHRNSSLRSCLIHQTTIEVFSQKETAEYIAYRLDTAGYSTALFGFSCLHLIHRATGGKVGDINRLCEHVLTQPLDVGTGCYGVPTLCSSIDALGMQVGEPEDEEDIVFPTSSQSVVPSPPQQKVNWEQAVQVAAREELASGLQPDAETSDNVGLKKESMAKNTKRWWKLTVPAVAVLGLCFYLVVPQMGSKEEIERTPIKVVKNNALLKELVDELVDDKDGVQPPQLPPEKVDVHRDDGLAMTGQDDNGEPDSVADSEPVTPLFAIEEDVAVEPKKSPQPMALPDQLTKLEEDVAVEEVIEEVVVPVATPPVQKGRLLPKETFVRVMRLKAGSNGLTDSAKQNIEVFVIEAKLFAEAQIIVKGYVSSDTVSEENTGLSLKRANVVRDLLIKEGIPADRIEVRGMGVQDPVATNSTVDGRNKNRRAVLELLTTKYQVTQD